MPETIKCNQLMATTRRRAEGSIVVAETRGGEGKVRVGKGA